MVGCESGLAAKRFHLLRQHRLHDDAMNTITFADSLQNRKKRRHRTTPLVLKAHARNDQRKASKESNAQFVFTVGRGNPDRVHTVRYFTNTTLLLLDNIYELLRLFLCKLKHAGKRHDNTSTVSFIIIIPQNVTNRK